MLNLKVEMIILVHFMKAVLVWLLKVRVGQEAYLFIFDASRSNSIYGSSDTVQPPAVTVRYLIKAA